MRTCPYIRLTCLTFTFFGTLQSQWIQTTGQPGFVAGSFAAIGTSLFAATSGGIYQTTDNGGHWATRNFGLTDTSGLCITAAGNLLFYGTPSGVFRSTDIGTSWALSLSVSYVQELATKSSALFAGTMSNGVFRSTDNGVSWMRVNSGLTDSSVTRLEVSGNNLYAGTQQGVFRSTNDGGSWTSVGLTNVGDLAAAGSSLFASTYGSSPGVYLSTNNGTSWSPVNSGLTDLNVLVFAVHGANTFAGTAFAGVLLFENAIGRWRAVDSGMTDRYVTALGVSGTDLFAGTMNPRIWRRPLSEMTSLDDPYANEMPQEFCLGQNYPNPFNPATTIQFTIPAGTYGHTSLRVYDVLGRKVETLVNEVKQPGTYTVQFDASNLTSGVYLCRLQTGRLSETKKLVRTK